jgi:hypothetical protein
MSSFLCAAMGLMMLVGFSITSFAQSLVPPMTFRMEQGVMIADGAITAQTADDFRAILKAEGLMGRDSNLLVFLRSPGGVLETGLELGRLIRLHRMSVAAFGNCDSACTYVFMGGVQRVVIRGTRFGVHQFYNADALAKPDEKYYTARDFIENQKLIARLSEYVDEMGIDQAVLALASKTAPDSVNSLTRQQLQAYRIENVSTREAQGQAVGKLKIPGVFPVDLSRRRKYGGQSWTNGAWSWTTSGLHNPHDNSRP